MKKQGFSFVTDSITVADPQPRITWFFRTGQEIWWDEMIQKYGQTAVGIALSHILGQHR